MRNLVKVAVLLLAVAVIAGPGISSYVAAQEGGGGIDNGAPINDMDWNADGSLLAIGHVDGVIEIVDSTTWQIVTTFEVS